jgi:ADP-ribosyl glycohydrolase, putative
MARAVHDKEEIRAHIERNYYPLNFRIDDIRAAYQFNETCQETVPQAIQCFVESTSFEDAIRTAISLGGDSDTVGAITGAIAEAYYGVPDWMREKALIYLDDRLRVIYEAWEREYGMSRETFHVLTKYIGKLSKVEHTVDWVDNVNPANEGNTPKVQLNASITMFEEEFCAFLKEYPAYHLMNYADILQSHRCEWSEGGMSVADVSKMEAQSVFALITGAVRAEHLCGGTLKVVFEYGKMDFNNMNNKMF